eukprot:768137-Hanusia_phi.AAC.23
MSGEVSEVSMSMKAAGSIRDGNGPMEGESSTHEQAVLSHVSEGVQSTTAAKQGEEANRGQEVKEGTGASVQEEGARRNRPSDIKGGSGEHESAEEHGMKKREQENGKSQEGGAKTSRQGGVDTIIDSKRRDDAFGATGGNGKETQAGKSASPVVKADGDESEQMNDEFRHQSAVGKEQEVEAVVAVGIQELESKGGMQEQEAKIEHPPEGLESGEEGGEGDRKEKETSGSGKMQEAKIKDADGVEGVQKQKEELGLNQHEWNSTGSESLEKQAGEDKQEQEGAEAGKGKEA